MHRDYFIEFGGNYFDCIDNGFNSMERVDVVIRPEDIIIEPPSEKNIIGTVETVTFKGVHYEMIIESFGFKWIVHSTTALNTGEVTGMNVLPENIHIMKKTSAENESSYEPHELYELYETNETDNTDKIDKEEININDI
jgi:spermidine/putrescine transport system ATP-binding protein